MDLNPWLRSLAIDYQIHALDWPHEPHSQATGNTSLLPSILCQNPEQQHTTDLAGQCYVTTVTVYEIHEMDGRSTPAHLHPVPHASAATIPEPGIAPKITVSREMFPWEVDEVVLKKDFYLLFTSTENVYGLTTFLVIYWPCLQIYNLMIYYAKYICNSACYLLML